MHPFQIDAQGNLYVDLGSTTNSCQKQNRTPNSPGINPCTELRDEGGTWVYDANKTGQHFSPSERFATGLRNGEGFAFDSAGRLFATQHGRDQLSQNWPKTYSAEQGARARRRTRSARKGRRLWLALLLFRPVFEQTCARSRIWRGWQKAGLCAEKKGPLAAFPAHWAPNDLTIYNADQFPAPYRAGAFIAFTAHGTVRPCPRAATMLSFSLLPTVSRPGNSSCLRMASLGRSRSQGRPLTGHRDWQSAPMAHSIFQTINADVSGASPTRAKRPSRTCNQRPRHRPRHPPARRPPEGVHPEAGRAETADLTPPPGGSHEEIVLGSRIFLGEASGGTCAGCHGSDAKGTPLAPSLTTRHWLWGDGSLNPSSRRSSAA